MSHSIPLEVVLVSATQYPVETVKILWEASRKNGFPTFAAPSQTVAETAGERNAFGSDAYALFQKVLDSDIPIAENIWFTFLLRHVSIAFREQMVRHRIGVKVGDRLGVDIVPDIHDSTWWSQSMRVLDMGNFASAGGFETPASIENNVDAHPAFLDAMASAQHVYRQLRQAGVPGEDARMVIPLAATHDISWTLNLAALKHIMSKRLCWILQLGFWGPVIGGMLNELRRVYGSLFNSLGLPPCLTVDSYSRCHFCLDNEKRFLGEDPLPPCYLWLQNEARETGAALLRDYEADGAEAAWYVDFTRNTYSPRDPNEGALFEEMRKTFTQLWFGR